MDVNKCPECGRHNIHVVVPAMATEEEVYKCPCCETIFDVFEILVKGGK